MNDQRTQKVPTGRDIIQRLLDKNDRTEVMDINLITDVLEALLDVLKDEQRYQVLVNLTGKSETWEYYEFVPK